MAPEERKLLTPRIDKSYHVFITRERETLDG